MKKVFIVGNGFDIAHGLPTSYSEFQKFLKIKYPNIDTDTTIYSAPEPSMMPDGEEIYDEEEVATLLMTAISQAEHDGENWCNVEDSLGILDFGDLFHEDDDFLDKEGDIHYSRLSSANEYIASNLIAPMSSIIDLFKEWINTINVEDSKSKFNDFIKLTLGHDNRFLSFNYTTTLQKLYNENKVCHIHGLQGEKIFFGHGNDENYDDEDLSLNIGSEYGLHQLQNNLRKNTKEALEKHSDFFKSEIVGCKEIYTFGFSFSKVDLVYIKKICHEIDTKNIIWYLNDFKLDNSEYDKIDKILKECGFEGIIKKYKIEK